jgi:hypothetical protein
LFLALLPTSMRAAFYLLPLAIFLTACAQRSATTGATPPAATATPAFQKPRTVSTIPINTAPGDTALVYQRTPCYGTCPAYTATVFRDGRVSYFGERFVPVQGQQTLSLPQPTVQKLLDGARRINFTQLSPEYRAKVTDLPGTFVTVYLPGQPRHKVFAERGAAPKELQGYLDLLQGKLNPLAGLAVEK